MVADENGAATSRLRAPAKINLYLHVTGRRPDGFHELDSLVVFAGVGDGVSYRPGGPARLEITGPEAGALVDLDAEENLVMKAARRLAGQLDRSFDGTLTLDKHLPAAAGLGGGSADAAAVLRLLCNHWNVPPADIDLPQLGLSLGADVPVCLRPGATLASGIGEKLRPSGRLPAAHLVLVNPGKALSTADVFGKIAGPYGAEDPLGLDIDDVALLAAELGMRRNDLEASATALAPVIGDVLGRLAETEGCLLSRMSGSGASCFGLYATAEEARKGAAALEVLQPKWWIHAAPMLTDVADWKTLRAWT